MKAKCVNWKEYESTAGPVTSKQSDARRKSVKTAQKKWK